MSARAVYTKNCTWRWRSNANHFSDFINHFTIALGKPKKKNYIRTCFLLLLLLYIQSCKSIVALEGGHLLPRVWVNFGIYGSQVCTRVCRYYIYTRAVENFRLFDGVCVCGFIPSNGVSPYPRAGVHLFNGSCGNVQHTRARRPIDAISIVYLLPRRKGHRLTREQRSADFALYI